MNEADLLERFLKLADKGGAMSTAALLFLGNLCQAVFVIWLQKNHNKAESERNSTNEKSIEARLAMAQAMGKIADKTEELSDRVDRVQLILDERLARRA